LAAAAIGGCGGGAAWRRWRLPGGGCLYSGGFSSLCGGGVSGSHAAITQAERL
jgi:hypothetical protein